MRTDPISYSQAVAEFTPEQRERLSYLKRTRPFMIAYIAIHRETGDFQEGWASTMRRPNSLAGKGYNVLAMKGD